MNCIDSNNKNNNSNIVQVMISNFLLKFMFFKKATKIDEIFTFDLMVTTYCQIDSEDFVNFCGLLKKYELYERYCLYPQGQGMR